MIIGFAGKKQNGKDTAVNMWDYLSKTNGKADFTDYMNNPGALTQPNLKFADKLKDILCLLTGCTRDQLEEDDFKSSFMPEVWNIEKSIMGTYSKFDTLMRSDKKYIPLGSKSAAMGEVCTWKYMERMTYRHALQYLGTDALRSNFHPEVWVNATMVEAFKYDNCYISDVRFPNEVKAVENDGGIVIRVECLDKVSTDTHISETALDDWDFKYKVSIPFGLEYLFNSLKALYAVI